MIGQSFKKKILEIVLEAIDNTIGKKFPMIDKLTDLFQEQKVLENKVRDLELEIEAIKSYLKDLENEQVG
tara:strand:- start:136 stop:345 length:210 start_codon:yes stop_codon:yes gene_type:complete